MSRNVVSLDARRNWRRRTAEHARQLREIANVIERSGEDGDPAMDIAVVVTYENTAQLMNSTIDHARMLRLLDSLREDVQRQWESEAEK